MNDDTDVSAVADPDSHADSDPGSSTGASPHDAYVKDTFGVDPSTYAAPSSDDSATASAQAGAAPAQAPGNGGGEGGDQDAGAGDGANANGGDADGDGESGAPEASSQSEPSESTEADGGVCTADHGESDGETGQEPADQDAGTGDGSEACGPDDGSAGDDAAAATPAIPEHPILGSAQATRAAALLDKLSPDDKAKYQGLLDSAKNDQEKQYLTKALASGHSVSDIAAFQQKIAGKDAKWMQDNLSLTGSSEGTGVQQQWSHSCNATTVEAVKGELDPIYALKMHDDNPNMDEVDDSKPTADNPNLAADQKAMLTSTYTGRVADARGSSGVAAARDKGAQGAGRWADDLLNQNKDVTGVSYETKQIGNGASVDDAMTSIDSNVAQGTSVPLVIGNCTGQYTHYVLVTATDPGPPKTYSIHDPYSGETKIRTEAQMKQGKLDIANSNQITAFEKPTPVPVK